VTGIARWLSGRSARQRFGLAFFAGGLAATGLAPFDLPFLSLLGFAGLALSLMLVGTVRPAFWTGLAGGTG
jgi:apolipoprotein N-acyltransferase